MFNKILKTKKMPDEWRKSIRVPIYMNKTDIQNHSSYHGIKLISVEKDDGAQIKM